MKTIDNNFVNFDIIGDIHGHSNDLKKLLNALGYSNKKGYYQHPERKVLFIGDYIDRGINIIEVLDIVKKMVDNGEAIALMGNHEYNAICYNTLNANGDYLREHNPKNFNQHAVTMAAFMPVPNMYKMYIEWFKTLPLFYENDSFRAVHACWDNTYIDYLRTRLDENNCLTNSIIEESATEGTDLNKAVEVTLKGKEAKMPEGVTFIDKDRILRTEFRTKWWENPHKMTYSSISVHSVKGMPNTPFVVEDDNYYLETEVPVFFGHYWMEKKAGTRPHIQRENVCCVDFSVAKGDGILACYRYSGESKLNSTQLVFVK
ncbi:metallophosphoesterase [Myroides marinus]|uniref:metallophosphoesterase n=1 Tax=Myroides marinus TaxID=703342 RepID=UPI002574F159|nr:metallophosphoesterase [Myroides marinus]MDM1368413.1 metallophosphoesterase [Myroides marinus]MDM1374380.1 metallophosphoesterase [Myroides marinus]MDM1381347.1 metallophosphoesterase [Myroides marinus]